MPGRIGSAPSPAPQRRDLPDPALMRRDAAELKYARVQGDLFVDGPTPSDVRQGNLDDCYLLASVAALAHQRPDSVRSLIADNGDGTYSVQLFKKNFFGKAKAQSVVIDEQLPLRFGLIQDYGRSTAHDELWVGLLEKAYASMRGGYEKIGNMGHASDALFALTGQKASFVKLQKNASAASVASDLEARLDRGQLLVAASKNDAAGVRPQHSFAITGVEHANGKTFILVLDPIEPETVMRIPADQFLKLFQGFHAA